MKSHIKIREPLNDLRPRNLERKQAVESLLTEGMYKSITYIKADHLLPFKNQTRRSFDETNLEGLAASIKSHGVRQPLTVIESEGQPTFFEMVSGERRYKAALMAGLEKLPCIIIHDREKAEEIALVENIQREDLHPIELGAAYNRFIENNICHSQDEIAKKLGVPRTQVNEYMKYSTLPEEIAHKLISHKLSSREILRKVTKATSPLKMREVIDNILAKTNPERDKVLGRPRKKLKLFDVYLDDHELIVKDDGLTRCPSELKNRLLEIFEKLKTKLEGL